MVSCQKIIISNPSIREAREVPGEIQTKQRRDSYQGARFSREHLNILTFLREECLFVSQSDVNIVFQKTGRIKMGERGGGIITPKHFRILHFR